MSTGIVPDSEHRGLVARLPQCPRDLALLARIVRPASGLVRATDGAAVDGAFDAVFEGLRCRR